MSRRRQHPLVPLVLWLGVSLCVCLMALVVTLGQLPTARQLQETHTAGMKYGYELCMAWDEQSKEQDAIAHLVVEAY